MSKMKLKIGEFSQMMQTCTKRITTICSMTTTSRRCVKTKRTKPC